MVSTHASPELSIVIPVYNSSTCLNELYQRSLSSMEGVVEKFEIIMIEDSSSDSSWDVIMKLAKLDNRIHGIQLSRNYGQHNALLCGIRSAQGDIVVTIDDDLQNPPEEIPKLINKLKEGHDVVFGIPQKEQHSPWRNLASVATKIIIGRAIGSDMVCNVSAFRAFHTKIRDSFAHHSDSFISIDVLLSWGATRFVAVPVRHDARIKGESNYTFWKLITHALNMILGFSVLPLRIASFAGFAFILFGLGILIFVIVRFLISGGVVPGFPFLASIIVIFSGIQLFILGMIGEYLSRVYFRSMKKPPYMVRAIAGDKSVSS